MGEEYKGVKFNIVEVWGVLPDDEKLKAFGKAVAKLVKSKGREGNVSMRHGNGIIISPSKSRISDLKYGVYVANVVNMDVWVISGIPSSETVMHWKIYEKRKDVNFIAHFHDDRLLGLYFNNVVSGHFEYGTPELANAVANALKKENEVKIENHGFVVVGKTEKEVLERIKNIYNRINENEGSEKRV